MFSFKINNYGQSLVRLTAFFAGILLFFITAPIWNDGPPIPNTFFIKRWFWFPICELICLISFIAIYRILKSPQFENFSILLLSVFLSLNTSILLTLIGSDIYQTCGVVYEKYVSNFSIIGILILGINDSIILLFAFLGIILFGIEKLCSHKWLK